MTGTAARLSAARIGSWVAAATTVVGVVFVAVAITTPPRSGPWCREGCVRYPYTDAAAFVPRDYWWMYPGIVFSLLFVALATCLHAWVAQDRKVPAAVAVCFATMGGAVIVLDYGVQLTVLRPALLTGETQGLSGLTQYNPHGVFIAAENVGYSLFGIAFLCLGLALGRGESRLEAGVRWVFTAGGALVMAALPLFAVIFGAELDYRFEVASLGITWLVLISAGALLTVVFRRGSGRVSVVDDRHAQLATRR